MSVSLRTGWLAVCAALLLFAGVAQADPIDYIFSGTGTGTLDGTAFSGSFTVTDVADTAGITSGGGEYRNTPSSSTFTAGALTDTLSDPLIIENTTAPGYMGFTESVSPFNGESLTNSVFETYALNTALASTSGGLSVGTGALGTLPTSGGDLVFTSITALSFEAIVPEASTLALYWKRPASIGRDPPPRLTLVYRSRTLVAPLRVIRIMCVGFCRLSCV
jgi:hypothetical protein